MTLRLSGDTSGFTEIKAADAAGDNSIKLPAANGSANQLLQNGGTAGELQYTSAGSGLHYDASGRLLLGTPTARTDYYGSLASDLQVQGTTFAAISTHTTTGNGAVILSRETIINGSTVGNLSWQGHDGSTLVEAASITGRIEGAPGGSIMPGKLVFSTNSGGSSVTPRVEITSNGALKLLAGCPGIDFSATQPAASAGTMTSETLDSYEEGTFTPSYLMTGVNGTMSQSFSHTDGRYVKVGKICFIAIDMRLSSFNKGTGTGAVRVQGLPFIPAQTSNYTRATGLVHLYNWNYSATATDNPVFSVYQNSNQTWMDISVQRLGNTGADLLDPGNTSMLFMSGCYETKD